MMGKQKLELLSWGLFRKTLGLLFVGVHCTACATANTLHPTTMNFQSPKLDIRAQLSSQEVLPGTIVLIRLESSQMLQSVPVMGEFEGITFPFFPENPQGGGGSQAVLGIPYDRKPGPGIIYVTLGEGASASHLEVALNVFPGEYPSESLRVDSRRVNPTRRKDLQRIRAEQSEVGAIYQRVTQQKLWQGPFVLPIHSKITSPFGTRRIYNGAVRNYHPGLDLRAPQGTPVRASAPGIVVLAKSLFFTGNTVILDHGYGIVTLYAHMSRLSVKLGQRVEMQQKLGLSGKTGRVNGPHLHWQAVVHQVKINPLGLTQVMR